MVAVEVPSNNGRETVEQAGDKQAGTDLGRWRKVAGPYNELVGAKGQLGVHLLRGSGCMQRRQGLVRDGRSHVQCHPPALCRAGLGDDAVTLDVDGCALCAPPQFLHTQHVYLVALQEEADVGQLRQRQAREVPGRHGEAMRGWRGGSTAFPSAAAGTMSFRAGWAAE